jgi:hypothetical protein
MKLARTRSAHGLAIQNRLVDGELFQLVGERECAFEMRT